MDSNSESVWYGAPPAPETLSALEPQHEDERHVRLRTDARYFLLLSLALGAVFALLFVNAYALGLNAALLAAAMAGGNASRSASSACGRENAIFSGRSLWFCSAFRLHGPQTI